MNKATSDRVAHWQSLESLPEGHSIPLMEIGKRVLKGLVEAIEIPTSSAMADTEDLVEQAKELQAEEERLKSDFPAATKVLDDESGSTSSEAMSKNGHESESSGVLVEKEDCITPKEEKQGPALSSRARSKGQTQDSRGGDASRGISGSAIATS